MRSKYEAYSGEFSKKRELSIHEQENKAIKKKLKEVTLERDILRKCGKHLLQERQIIYDFISRERNNFPVERMCKCLKISKNAFYHWLKKKDLAPSITTKKRLMKKIQVIFSESREIYGSYRIQKMLERENLFYSRSYIALLMREMGLKSGTHSK